VSIGRRLIRLLVGAAVVFAGGTAVGFTLADDASEGDQDTNSVEPARDEAADVASGESDGEDRYCVAAAEYALAMRSLGMSASTAIEDFARAAALARQLADLAPSELQPAHEAIADGAELLVERLREAAPQSDAELAVAGARIADEVEAEIGDLEAETAEVVAYVEERCGLPVG
jgi:uncharacterized membrane protein YccC